MSLNFEVYKSKELTDLGTVMDAIGAKGTLSIAPASLIPGTTKLLTIILKKKNGTSTAVACSKNVSRNARHALASGMSNEEVLAIIAKLNIIEGETKDGKEANYIVAPRGSAVLEEFTIEQLVKIKDVDYADLANASV